MIGLTEDAHFLSLILRTSVKDFRPNLGASLIKDFHGNQNKKFKFVVYFLIVFKYCSLVRLYFETNVVLGNYKQASPARENTLCCML